MRLTLHTDYALRMLMYLGLQDDRLTTIEEVAERYGVSKNHLMKVAQQLARAGLIEAVRGRNGGLRLARPAERITVGEVVRLTEDDFAVVACFQPGGTNCRITPDCELRHALGRAVEAFLTVLDGCTLAELLKPRNALARRLALA